MGGADGSSGAALAVVLTHAVDLGLAARKMGDGHAEGRTRREVVAQVGLEVPGSALAEGPAVLADSAFQAPFREIECS